MLPSGSGSISKPVAMDSPKESGAEDTLEDIAAPTKKARVQLRPRLCIRKPNCGETRDGVGYPSSYFSVMSQLYHVFSPL